MFMNFLALVIDVLKFVLVMTPIMIVLCLVVIFGMLALLKVFFQIMLKLYTIWLPLTKNVDTEQNETFQIS